MEIPTETDLGFLEDVKSDNAGARVRFVDTYAPAIARQLRSHDVPIQDANDLLHDVLLVVFQQVAKFERRRTGSFRAWLRAITRNVAITYFRGKARRPISGAQHECAIERVSKGKLTAYEHVELADLFEVALRQLSPTQAAVIRDTFVLEKSAAELAIHLRTTDVAARKAKSRAIAAFRAACCRVMGGKV